jgi:MFS family permease
MDFFKNRQINLLNLHTILERFGASVVQVFGMVFLYKQGIELHIILFMWAGVYAIRFLVRPFSFYCIQKKIGLKKSLILGTITFAGVFPILAQIDGFGIWFFIFIVYWAISDTFYWLPFHAYYAAMGEVEHRGKHVGIREGATMIVNSIAPITGGFLIAHVGFWSAYLLATVVMILAIIPVLLTKNVSPGPDMSFKKAKKELDRRGLWLLFGDGIFYNFSGALWPIVLFLLVKDIVLVGGIFTIQMIVTAGVTVFLGQTIDKGRGARVVNITFLLAALVVLGRGLYVYDVKSILTFEFFSALMACFYAASLYSANYNISKKSQNTQWYQFFGESGWDIGAFIAFMVAGFWSMGGLPLRYVMPFALIGMLIIWKVLSPYYKK